MQNKIAGNQELYLWMKLKFEPLFKKIFALLWIDCRPSICRLACTIYTGNLTCKAYWLIKDGEVFLILSTEAQFDS